MSGTFPFAPIHLLQPIILSLCSNNGLIFFHCLSQNFDNKTITPYNHITQYGIRMYCEIFRLYSFVMPEENAFISSETHPIRNNQSLCYWLENFRHVKYLSILEISLISNDTLAHQCFHHKEKYISHKTHKVFVDKFSFLAFFHFNRNIFEAQCV